jgi:molecular chaperone DnaK
MTQPNPLGIDLGTTYSVIATVDASGQPIIIPNHLGENLTPSVVDLDTGEVGLAAKERSASDHADSVIAFFKRDMGNRQALYLHGGKTYTPTDLSALVLTYLKKCAEDHLGHTCTDAVITVPAYFNNSQREATIAAGKQAGLNVLRIINEPTAAALAFGMRPGIGRGFALVYDLGGGTFDVSLVDVGPGALRVIGTAGDHFLGGKDFDDRLLNHLTQLFEDEHALELEPDELDALLVAAEQAKITLSQRSTARVTVQAAGRSSTYEITRATFEGLCTDLLERTGQLATQLMEGAGGSWGDLDGVILVGGSTRMPMVRQFVEAKRGQNVASGVHPDEAVALGAALQATLDEPQGQLLLGGFETQDVIGNSLGMIAENADRTAYINSIIIPRNQPIPARHTRPYQLRVSSQRSRNKLEVFMTQGESSDPQDVSYLGQYVFSGIPSVAGRVAVIDISYAYNKNGVVEVTAVERSTQTPLPLRIEPLPADVPARFTQPPEDIQIAEHVTVYMALDVSGSMAGRPLEEAKQAALSFMAEVDLSQCSIGVMEWSDRVQTLAAASQNAKQVARALNGLRVGRTGSGTSGNPFAAIYKALVQAEGVRYGLVLTDGALYNQQAAIESANQCKRAGIEIIAIGFGRARRDFLQRVSSSDAHSFFVDMNQLTTTFSTIAQEITEGGGEIDPKRLEQRRRGLRLL